MATDRLLYEESAVLFMIKYRKKKKNKEIEDAVLPGPGMHIVPHVMKHSCRSVVFRLKSIEIRL